MSSLMEFHRARLVALDNWNLAQEAMASSSFPVRALTETLGVTELGAHSIIAMLRSESVPERAHIEQHLHELEQMRYSVTDRSIGRRVALARSSARHMLA
ncbi:hypothetical protein [Aeromicrobium sp. CTD01-1L150]|uniref:hypothetical protein n=1 Tax=Aeromicrobium sp. CTD01-1L150 TaxID=3341830 RepID=UPI0035BF970D